MLSQMSQGHLLPSSDPARALSLVIPWQGGDRPTLLLHLLHPSAPTREPIFLLLHFGDVNSEIDLFVRYSEEPPLGGHPSYPKKGGEGEDAEQERRSAAVVAGTEDVSGSECSTQGQ